jgi:hypothetical protein
VAAARPGDARGPVPDRPRIAVQRRQTRRCRRGDCRTKPDGADLNPGRQRRRRGLRRRAGDGRWSGVAAGPAAR